MEWMEAREENIMQNQAVLATLQFASIRKIEDFAVQPIKTKIQAAVTSRSKLFGGNQGLQVFDRRKAPHGKPYMRAVLAAHLRYTNKNSVLIMQDFDLEPAPAIPRNELLVPADTSRFFPVQQQLGLSKEFSPSRALVSYWVNGVESHRPKNINRAPQIAVNINSQLQSEFAKFFREFIAMIGQQRRYSTSRRPSFVEEGRIITSLQNDICDKFQIVQDEAAEFLSLLTHELQNALQDGASIGGLWGKLRLINHGNVIFELNEPDFPNSTNFVKSKRVR